MLVLPRVTIIIIIIIIIIITIIIIYYNSMEQSPSWEANRSSASQETPCILRNPKGHCIH